MDRQKKAAIVLVVGIVALAVVIPTVTLPGMRRSPSNVAKPAGGEQQALQPTAAPGIQPTVPPQPTAPTGVPAAVQPSAVVVPGGGAETGGGVTASNMPLKVNPPKNPFGWPNPAAYRAQGPPPPTRVVEGFRVPFGSPPSIPGGPMILPPATLPEAGMQMPVLKGTVLGRERLAVLHYDNQTLYLHPGQRIDERWKVGQVRADSITLIEEVRQKVATGKKVGERIKTHEVPLRMKGEL